MTIMLTENILIVNCFPTQSKRSETYKYKSLLPLRSYYISRKRLVGTVSNALPRSAAPNIGTNRPPEPLQEFYNLIYLRPGVFIRACNSNDWGWEPTATVITSSTQICDIFSKFTAACASHPIMKPFVPSYFQLIDSGLNKTEDSWDFVFSKKCVCQQQNCQKQSIIHE